MAPEGLFRRLLAGQSLSALAGAKRTTCEGKLIRLLTSLVAICAQHHADAPVIVCDSGSGLHFALFRWPALVSLQMVQHH